MSCKSLKKPSTGVTMGLEIIKFGVGIGDNRQTFTIHKSLLQKFTKYFDKALDTESGKSGNIFLNENNPEIFGLFVEWIYNGTVALAPTSIPIRVMPSQVELDRLEIDLRFRFDAHSRKLVLLYALAEEYGIHDLMNKTIDAIQDGFYQYGTVFGPALNMVIFQITKKGSKLRDLCVGANVLHMDRGCTSLRQEVATACVLSPGYLTHMLKWIASNFHLFSRRQVEGYDNRDKDRGFSILNRKKLCPCHFHTHEKPTQAHKGHTACAVPILTCAHGGDDDDDENENGIGGAGGLSQLLAALGANGDIDIEIGH